MLRLVVRRAAPVKLVALFDQLEGMQTVAPLLGLGADDIAMAIRQDRRQVLGFDTGRNQYRARPRFGVRVDFAVEPHALKPGHNALAKIAIKLCRLLPGLAFAWNGHQCTEVTLELSAIEVLGDCFDCRKAAHGGVL